MVEHKKHGAAINYEAIYKAVVDLYGGWHDFSDDSKLFIKEVLKNNDFENIYVSIKNDEFDSREMLIGFEEDYSKVLKESNINDILKVLKS